MTTTLPDGSCIRDYIDVVDLAKAHVIAMKRMLENNDTDSVEIFNLGTGNGLSVLQSHQCFRGGNRRACAPQDR